jgi:putative transposase
VFIEPDRAMYRWRRMTPFQREATLEYRKVNHRPWHSPPHYESEIGLYLITAACYEHRPIVGQSPERMAKFEKELLDVLYEHCRGIFAWVVLPNHYHTLVRCDLVKALLKELGRLHGRTSFQWNGEENRRGRKVWCNAVETEMKSERHFWTTMNYVLHNAVRHRYATQWQDWPYSNAAAYLNDVGREEALRRWNEYPLLDYGKKWDPPEL